MKQCQIHDNSLRFSRAVYGIMVLIAFFLHSQWLILLTAILVALGAFSLKVNLFYQLHVLVIKKILKDQRPPVFKESGEMSFVAGMTAALLLAGFLMLYFGNFAQAAWIFILVVDLLIFLACFVGFCVATLMYVLLKRLFAKK